MFAGYMYEILALCIAGRRSFGYNIHPFLFACAWSVCPSCRSVSRQTTTPMGNAHSSTPGCSQSPGSAGPGALAQSCPCRRRPSEKSVYIAVSCHPGVVCCSLSKERLRLCLVWLCFNEGKLIWWEEYSERDGLCTCMSWEMRSAEVWRTSSVHKCSCPG